MCSPRRLSHLWLSLLSLIAVALLVWPLLTTLHLGLAMLLKALQP